MNTLRTDIAGITFSNPVMTASGTCGYGLDMLELIDLNRLGAICTKGAVSKTHARQRSCANR